MDVKALLLTVAHAWPSIAAFLLVIFVGGLFIGWKFWKRDQLEALALSRGVISFVATLGLYPLVAYLQWHFSSDVLSASVGIFLSVFVASLLGYLFGWFAVICMLLGVSIAQLCRVPQNESLLNNSETWKLVGKFLRESSAREDAKPSTGEPHD